MKLAHRPAHEFRLRPVFLFLLLLLSLACSRGAVKGPVGQGEAGEQGVGLKVPILDLFDRKTYSAEKFSPDNISEEEINPFREKEPLTPSTEPFSSSDDPRTSF